MRMRLRPLHIAVLLAIGAISPLRAQCDDTPGPDGLTWDYDEPAREGFSIGGFLRDAFTPEIITDTKTIRSYVRDERFRILTKRCGEMRAVDAIYIRALKIANYQIARALFLSVMAVLEHQEVEIKIPVVESMKLPLTFEEDSLFHVRFNSLPTHLYPDTPPEGDRDKLQHFFGSAYLAYATESPELARASGNAIEWGEAQFVVGGSDDPRDKRSNKQGERFGRDLLIVKTLLPSDYLTLPGTRQGDAK
jgi:hypothetical protein